MVSCLCFGASTSILSINKQLAVYAWSYIQKNFLNDISLQTVDLNNYLMPLYSVDREQKKGIPIQAVAFRQLLKKHDWIIVSFAEHNGSYTSAFKNLLDWWSRYSWDFWEWKVLFVLATSPGKRWWLSVLESALQRIPRMGGTIGASFSLPSFYEHFSTTSGITDIELHKNFEVQAKQFLSVLT